MRISAINSNYINKNPKNNMNVQSPSFKGLTPEPVVKGLAGFYENVAAKKGFQNFIKKFSQADKSFTYIMVAESVILSSFYMINTLRNKKIKKEQKPQMLINDTLTLGVSAAGSLFADEKITNLVNKGAEKFFANHADFYTKLGKEAAEANKSELLNKVAEVAGKKGSELSQGIEQIASSLGNQLKGVVGEEGKLKAFQITGDNLTSIQNAVKETVANNAGNAEKAKETVKNIVDDVYNSAAARVEADKIMPGINKLKVIIVFGLIYRYLGPVVITPIANKLSSKIFNKKQENKEQEANQKK